jgi:hypothetical protein
MKETVTSGRSEDDTSTRNTSFKIATVRDSKSGPPEYKEVLPTDRDVR